MRNATVDTGVLRAANGSTGDGECARQAVLILLEVRDRSRVLLDFERLILKEYLRNARSAGEPGVGDAFLKWVLGNLENPERCEIIELTRNDERGFEEFPEGGDLHGFDDDDRVFVSVTLAGAPANLYVAIDTDYWEYERPLVDAGVTVELVCRETLKAVAEVKGVSQR